MLLLKYESQISLVHTNIICLIFIQMVNLDSDCILTLFLGNLASVKAKSASHLVIFISLYFYTIFELFNKIVAQ